MNKGILVLVAAIALFVPLVSGVGEQLCGCSYNHPPVADVINATPDENASNIGMRMEPGEIIFRPAAGLNDGTDDGSINKGKDTTTVTYTQEDGLTPYMRIVTSNGCNNNYARGYIQFNVDDLPSDVEKVELVLYQMVWFNGYGWPWYVSPTIGIHRVTSPWDEMSMIWATQPSVDPTVIAYHTIPTTGGGSWGNWFTEFEGPLSYDITQLYRDWKSGTVPNYGMQVTMENSLCVNGDETLAYTSDDTDVSRRPYLIITPAKIDADGDGYSSDVDCNDNDPSIHPGANEVCNAIDDNCNGQIDEGIGISPNEIDSHIQSLNNGLFKPPASQRKNAFSNKLSAIDKKIANKDYKGAINQLQNDIRTKTDGSLGDNPNDDWITNPKAQAELCCMIDKLIDNLQNQQPITLAHPG